MLVVFKASDTPDFLQDMSLGSFPLVLFATLAHIFEGLKLFVAIMSKYLTWGTSMI